MKLTAVHYELYRSDVQWLDHNADVDRHVLDREIRLTFFHAPQTFISWSDTPIQYAIGYRDRSFFVNEANAVRDMTASAMWSPIVGHEVDMKFEDDDHQVLRIESLGSLGGAVFCCSYETDWEADVVMVANQAPNR